MNLSLPALTKVLPDFGRRVHDTADFWRAAEVSGIEVAERRLKKRGYYVAESDGDLIFIDSRLKDFRWLCVAYHEIVHAILHYPSPFLAGKHQFEANAFSIMLICPLSELAPNSNLRHFAGSDRVARLIIRQREQINFLYQDFGFNL